VPYWPDFAFDTRPGSFIAPCISGPVESPLTSQSLSTCADALFSAGYCTGSSVTLQGAFPGLTEGPANCSVDRPFPGVSNLSYPMPWDATCPSNLNESTGGTTGLGEPMLDKPIQQPWEANMLSGASALRSPERYSEGLHGSGLSTEQVIVSRVSQLGDGLLKNRAQSSANADMIRNAEHLGRPQEHSCFDCHTRFKVVAFLEHHASETGHAAFVCSEDSCGSRFLRKDVYLRHMLGHTPGAPRHPCHLCGTYRGSKGFKRKDHLTQHLHNYHHVALPEWYSFSRLKCNQGDCLMEFKKQSELTAHLKKEHDYSEFPCDEPGCNRVGGKGYTRKIDLLKHKAKVHNEESA